MQAIITGLKDVTARGEKKTIVDYVLHNGETGRAWLNPQQVEGIETLPLKSIISNYPEAVVELEFDQRGYVMSLVGGK